MHSANYSDLSCHDSHFSHKCNPFDQYPDKWKYTPRSQGSPPEIVGSSATEMAHKASDMCMESVPQTDKLGRATKRFRFDTKLNFMQPKGQYAIFSNFHFSTLLDALDLCKNPIKPLEYQNVIRENSSMDVQPNAVVGNLNK